MRLAYDLCVCLFSIAFIKIAFFMVLARTFWSGMLARRTVGTILDTSTAHRRCLAVTIQHPAVFITVVFLFHKLSCI